MAELKLRSSEIEGDLQADNSPDEAKISELSYSAEIALIGGDETIAGGALCKIIEILHGKDPEMLLKMLENSDERGKAIAKKIRDSLDSRCLG